MVLDTQNDKQQLVIYEELWLRRYTIAINTNVLTTIVTK